MSSYEESPLLGTRTYKETGTTFLYITIAISALGAANFGWTLGYTSPIMVSNHVAKLGGDPASLLCPTYCNSNGDSLCFSNGSRVPDCIDEAYDPMPLENGTCPDGAKPYPKKDMLDNAHKMNCDLQMSQQLNSLFGSIVNAGCLIGALGGGGVVDGFGKRKSMILMNLLYTVGWAIIWQIPSPSHQWVFEPISGHGHEVTVSNAGTISAMLLVGRVLVGIAVGLSCCTVSAFQTEICPIAIRGAVGTVFQIFIVIGIFSSYLIGSIVTWRIMALIGLILSILSFVLTFFLRESPVWLLAKGRELEARETLETYRAGASVDDLEVMLDGMRSTEKKEQAGGLKDLFFDKVNRKTLFIGVGLMLVQQLSGINAIMFYSGTILQTVSSSAAQANSYATGMQGMQVIVTFSSAFFMDRAGRVPILLFAATGMVVSSYILAYFYIFTTGGPKLMALVAFYAYVFFFGCGMGAIPWSIMGEIFQPSVKGLASSFATAVNWSSSFVITYTVSIMADGFQDMFKNSHEAWSTAHPHAGMGVVFFMYGSVALLGILFIKAFIPETKGKTMSQIQAELRGDKTYQSIQ